MKNLDEIEEDLLQKGMVNHRHTPLKLFGAVISEIRKCSLCRKNKKLQEAINALMRRFLYTKRGSDK
ncbi:MAG TPA: hypothetical protein ENI13_01405 [candidate division CPR3 bacterium]|uniref:Uncharacterized protein n=1 Tax=candidate division CPR3 bacterium TaxID=2268181 RepID=A0A7C1SN13_UNCC3|nr:hypothetical protein [candidate division CPR3 bacterium]